MKRRVGFLVLVATVLALLLTGLFAGTAAFGSVEEPEEPEMPDVGVTFVAVSGIAGEPHVVLLEGSGVIEGDEVEAMGAFTHFFAEGPAPHPIVDSGTWEATELVSFSILGTFGAHAAGTLVMDVIVTRSDGSQVPATMIVNCNIEAAGLDTGMPEGVTIMAEGAVFEPLGGATLFSMPADPAEPEEPEEPEDL
ncbi:MAG: hypothetical protein HY681_07640 [Chloroflexi bacterium]|nr:hypothetical protein [Chloroflexota bacterium]